MGFGPLRVCMLVAALRRVQRRSPSFLTCGVVVLASAVSGCAVPEVSFYGEEAGPDAPLDAGVRGDVAGDTPSEAVADAGHAGDGGEAGDCGAATCCGSIPCTGDCSDCQACVDKCGGSGPPQQCCVKQNISCRSIGMACPP